MFKLLVKIVVGALVLVVLFAICLTAVQSCGNEVVDTAVTTVTGNEDVGDLANKIMQGQDVSDSEYEEAFDVDSTTYEYIEDAAQDAGIDLNDSEQIKDIVTENVDKLPQVNDIISEVKSGAIDKDQAIEEITSLLESAKGK